MEQINLEISDQELFARFGDLDTLFKQADIDNDGFVNSSEAVAFYPRFNISTAVCSYVTFFFSKYRFGKLVL